AGSAAEAMREVTPEQEMYLGNMVAARILHRYPLYQNEPVQDYVNLVGTVVAARSSRPDIPYRFAVLDTPEINAMAAPGGVIFITRGLLATMRNEDELACVLGHEIAHVAGRHAIRMIKKARWQQVAAITAREGLAATGRAPSALVNLAGKMTDRIMDVLLKGGYDRAFEYEADKKGRLFAARAGYDPAALAVLVARIKTKMARGGGMLASLGATHPDPDDRLKSLGGETMPLSVATPATVAVRAQRFKQVVGVR
ncbi:MAG: M48 family metalloprotease, partial [Proteobacteria bacterium]|nr:M48 family metalloprotease [Pseudomonadota bacterium]